MKGRNEAEIRPPRHLSREARDWFRSVAETWELEPHHLKLLAMAAQTFDEVQQATAVVHRDGPITAMPSGAKRPHPALRIAQEGRVIFARLLRELDLDVAPPAEAKRPPNLRSIVGGRG